jgi:hypothetical protein
MKVNLSDKEMQHIEFCLVAYANSGLRFLDQRQESAWKSKTGGIRRKFTQAKKTLQNQAQQGPEGR